MTRRVLILGLDGFGHDFVGRVLARGDMPFISSCVRDGVFVAAASTVPPVSTAAWTTVATGVGVGRHGVVDFRRRDIANYGFLTAGRLVSSRDVLAPPLYQRAGAAGRRCLVVNLPVSYPASRVNGVMVTGVLTPPGSGQGFWPPAFAPHVAGYDYDLDAPVPPDLAGLCARLAALTEGRVRVVEAACRQERFDLGLVVFTGPDRLFHRYYDEVYAAPSLPAPAAAYLRALDDACARVYELFGGDAALLVCSDHGFDAGPTRGLAVNRLLRREGWLAVGGAGRYALNVVWEGVKRLWGKAAPLPVDWRRTTAYAFPFYMRWGAAVLNVRGEQPQGVLAPEEADAAAARLARLLTGERVDGAPVCRWVKRRDELYAGPALANLPHVVFEAAPGFAITEAKGPGPLVEPFAHAAKRGDHSPAAMLVAAGPGITRGTPAGVGLADVAPTAARLLGLDPADMDGRPLAEILAA